MIDLVLSVHFTFVRNYTCECIRWLTCNVIALQIYFILCLSAAWCVGGGAVFQINRMVQTDVFSKIKKEKNKKKKNRKIPKRKIKKQELSTYL